MTGATLSTARRPGPPEASRRDPKGPILLFGLAACAAAGLVFAGHLRFYHRVDWVLALWWGLKDAFLWGALAPVIVRLTRRVPVAGQRWLPAVALHLLAAVSLTLLHSTLAVVGSALTEGLRGEPFWGAVQGLALKKAILSLLVYAVIAGSTHAVEVHRSRLSEGKVAARSRRRPPAEPPAIAERLLVRSHGRERFLDVARIDRIEAEGNYVRIHAGGESHLERRTLSSLEEQLDPSRFLRVHRSHLVNLDRVDRIEPRFQGGYAVVLRDGTVLRLSRTYRKRLEERIGRAF